MKNRSQLHHVRFSDSGRAISPRTGEHCPVNGWWAPLNDQAAASFIAEGSIMPAVRGMPVSWTLTVRPRRGYAAPEDTSLPGHP